MADSELFRMTVRREAQTNAVLRKVLPMELRLDPEVAFLMLMIIARAVGLI